MKAGTEATPRTRGSALLAVLWMTVILSFIGASLASSVRSEVASTQTMAQSEQGYFLARSGIEASLLKMMVLDEESFYYREYNFQLATGTVRVEYRPASAVYNVNLAGVPMLEALLVELGQHPADAQELAREIELYRHPQRGVDRNIESMEELLLLPGMTETLYYGGFVNGRRRPALYDVLGAFAAGDWVNVNYARLELLAVLPGMNETSAANLIAQRPIRKLDPSAVAQRLSLDDSRSFTLIAYGRPKDADFDRIVRAEYVRDQQRPLGVRMVAWHETN